MLSKRTKIWINYTLGPLLFVVLAYSIYREIHKQPNLFESWDHIIAALTGPSAWKLYLVILLMLLNWGLEARKWQIIVERLQPLSFFQSFKSILSGQAFALNTINRLGEYVGRVVYMAEGNRLRAIPLTIVSSLSQMIATFVVGTVALWVLRYAILLPQERVVGLSALMVDGLLYALTIGNIILVLLYYRLSWIIRVVDKLPWMERIRFFVQQLEFFEAKELTRILVLSLIRYFVFLLQYLLLLELFEVQANWFDLLCTVSVIFLVLAIVPTIALAELGLRGKVSLELLGLLSNNSVGIVTTAVGIWVINLLLPAIAGTLFILGFRLFKNKP